MKRSKKNPIETPEAAVNHVTGAIGDVVGDPTECSFFGHPAFQLALADGGSVKVVRQTGKIVDHRDATGAVVVAEKPDPASAPAPTPPAEPTPAPEPEPTKETTDSAQPALPDPAAAPTPAAEARQCSSCGATTVTVRKRINRPGRPLLCAECFQVKATA